MQVSLFLFRGLCAYLRDQNIDQAVLLHEAALSAEDIESSRGYVDQAVMAKAIIAAHRLTQDPALALHLGSNLPPQTVSATGHLFVQCATLRRALEEVQRYMPLIASAGCFALHEEGALAHLAYHPPPLGKAERRFAVELSLALLLGAARHFLGKRTTPTRVCLPYPRPEYSAEYAALFGCSLEFDANVAKLVFERSLLDEEQPFTNARAHRVLKEQAESMLLSEGRLEPLHLRVRAILREEELTLGERGRRMLASRLGLSARSLRRRLSYEGQTLWNLLESARQEHAFSLLRDTDTPLKNIAERLGFSEPSAFHRAFKRWTGQTPIQYRLDRQLSTRASEVVPGRRAESLAS
jgi:AraC-like DNA-binding protein